MKTPLLPRPLIRTEKKTGCAYCPLFPFAADFSPACYARKNADKIRACESLHAVAHRCVEEPWTQVDLLCVGECPGADEDARDAPFIGMSGQLLRNTLVTLLTETAPDLRVGFTNTVRCRTPRNRKPTKSEVACCVSRLSDEIQVRQPRMIVACGNTPMAPLTGYTGVTYYCGIKLDCTLGPTKCPVVINLHPAYVLRNTHELERFAETMLFAINLLTGAATIAPGHGTYEVLTTVEKVQALLERLSASSTPVAFDTETGSLTPFQSEFPRLLCFSFADEKFKGWTVPFDHSESPWKQDSPDRRAVTESLCAFFRSSAPKLAHNEKFDRQHIKHAIGVEPENVVDTMLLHLSLDERQGTHGLKELAHRYTGMGGYDKPLDAYKAANPLADPDRGGSYANIPGFLLFYYAAMDVDVTLRCYDEMRAAPDYADNPLQRSRVDTFLPLLSRTLANMEYRGAKVHPARARAIEDFLRAKAARVMERLKAHPEVVRTIDAMRGKKKSRREREAFAFNPRSPNQLYRLLFEECGMVPKELTDNGLARLAERWEALHAQDRRVTFDSVVDAARADKEWRHFSTKAQVMQDFAREGCKPAADVLEYRQTMTLADSFAVALNTLPKAGKVHGSFLIHGTKTGRLSARDPNLQNVPNKGGGLLKSAYVSRWQGGLILALDYSQIELRVAASYFREPTMIQAYVDGADLHTLTAIAISGLSAEDYNALPKEKQKEWRIRAKRVNFLALYGGGPPALVRTLRQDGVFVTEEQAQETLRNFYASRRQLERNMDRLRDRVQRDGRLQTFTGHIRRVPEVFADDRSLVSHALRQIVNFPIQCIAAQMMLLSLVLLDRELERRRFRSCLIATVHDSMLLDCPAEEALQAAMQAKYVMEHLPDLTEDVFPGLNWQWLRVPIVADCELGYSWGSGIDFDPATVEAEGAEESPLMWEEKGKVLYRKPVNVAELTELMAWKDAKVLEDTEYEQLEYSTDEY